MLPLYTRFYKNIKTAGEIAFFLFFKLNKCAQNTMQINSNVFKKQYF